MPRLSTRFHEKTTAVPEIAVPSGETGVSQKKCWPEGYFQLFGSVADVSFSEPEEPDRK